MQRHLAILLIFGSIVLGCSDSVTDPVVRPSRELFESESIPYDALGEGKLVFRRIPAGDELPGVYVVDVAARTARSIVGGEYFDGPSVSPDGRSVAYSRVTQEAPEDSPWDYGWESFWDIYVSDIEGTGKRQLTYLSGNEVSPAWLADSRAVVFNGLHESGAVEFFQKSVQTTESRPELIHTLPAAGCPIIEGSPAISPDSMLAFSGRFCGDQTSQGIYSVPMSGGDVTAIVNSPGETSEGRVSLYSPSWSPDGRHLAYVEVLESPDSGDYRSLRTAIKRYDVAVDSVSTLVTLDDEGIGWWASSNVISLCWSPDGSKIAFNHRAGQLTSHVYVVGRDGDGLRQITLAPGVSDVSLSWSR